MIMTVFGSNIIDVSVVHQNCLQTEYFDPCKAHCVPYDSNCTINTYKNCFCKISMNTNFNQSQDSDQNQNI